MKDHLKIFFAFTLFLLFSCEKNDDCVTVSNTDFVPIDSLLIEVGYDPENCKNLNISCPLGEDCDENYVYRAYSFNNSRLNFHISFDPDIVDNFSLESFKENFNYLNFSIYFPENGTTNSEFYYSNLKPIRKLNETTDDNLEFTIDSYENGIIKGVIKGTITEITEMIHSDCPDCFIGDILGVCAKTVKADMTFEVRYNFCIPN